VVSEVGLAESNAKKIGGEKIVTEKKNNTTPF
jgi:hypothetical protein